MQGQNLSENQKKANGKAIIPFFIFIIFYVTISVVCHDTYILSMPVAFLVASFSAFVFNRKISLNKKMEIYAQGMGSPNIMIMCMIFILAGMFAATAKVAGGVDSAVLIFRNLMPDNILLANFFLISCIISTAIGTSCGTITAMIPIACGLISNGFKIEPALLFGAVISGSMFGDNLSFISDTTIAATRTQCVNMKDKFLTNIKFVFPAAVFVFILYLVIGHGVPVPENEIPNVSWKNCVCIVPYFIVIIGSLCGLNVMALLLVGIISFILISMVFCETGLVSILKCLDDGTLSMADTLIVALLAGGLLHMIDFNGGLEYILKKIEGTIHGSRRCEFGVAMLVALINLFTANNTVAIVVVGPIAKKMGDKYHCSPKRIASILDAVSCIVQGMIPYGAQILIAIGLANAQDLQINSFDLIPYLYYPMVLLFLLIFWIFIGQYSRKQKT